ncbi:MAG: hypothetical protein U1G07_10545 [Verrucomicrobiota bacterium]
MKQIVTASRKRGFRRCDWAKWAFVFSCFATAVAHADFQGASHMMPFDEEGINYSKTKDSGPIARLQARLDQGKAELGFDARFGFLPALLRELGMASNSQMLVFSKTSFQRERISPHTPRALFMSDDAYIGFIPGSPLLEISAVDPTLGGVFYTLEQKAVPKPRFVRTDQCLECHASAKSMGVPGHLVRSFMTDENGVVDLASGISPVNHRTPLADRWGGWYVTGKHGSQTHRGNLIGQAAFERQAREPGYGGNVVDLSGFFETSRYLTPQSDLVALMVLEHQTHLHNFLTRLHYQASLALQQYGHVNYLNSIIEAFLKYLLFIEEAPLSGTIAGTSGYAEWFARQGPCDKQGRSLRQFDLQKRLFKYPCSYVIYSEAFDALPDAIRAKIFRRLWEILSGQDASADFARISPESKRVILEILGETKSDLPDYWKAPGRN